MADTNVISDVSETLRDFLDAGLSGLVTPATAEIHDLLGAVSTTPARVTLFLYDVCEDPSARNAPRVRQVSPPDVAVRMPPITLLLRYLLTPWGGSRDTEQQILGRVIQLLHDEAILSGPRLRGGLAGTDAALKITHAPISLEDRTRVWNSVQKPYRLSVTYEVRVARIDGGSIGRARQVLGRELVPAVGEEQP